MAQHRTHQDIHRDYYNENSGSNVGTMGALIALAAIAVVILAAAFYPDSGNNVSTLSGLEAGQEQPVTPATPSTTVTE